MTYADFRSGLTFADVRDELAAEQAAAAAGGERMYVTRSTVLGRWHQHKRALWDAYQRERRGNPPGLFDRLLLGGGDAAQTLLGRAGVRVASGYLPAGGLAGEAAVALAVGFVAARALGPSAGRMVLAGALAAPMERALGGVLPPLEGVA